MTVGRPGFQSQLRHHLSVTSGETWPLSLLLRVHGRALGDGRGPLRPLHLLTPPIPPPPSLGRSSPSGEIAQPQLPPAAPLTLPPPVPQTLT